MSDSPSSRLIWGLIAVVVMVVLFLRTIDTRGPIEAPEAEAFLRSIFIAETAQFGESARADVIAPDGELAQAPVALLGGAKSLGCPKVGGSTGTVAGRYGTGNRTYAKSSFECLYSIDGPEGLSFFLGAYILRDTSPSARDYQNGYWHNLLDGKETRALMLHLGHSTGELAAEEQAALWAQLARLKSMSRLTNRKSRLSNARWKSTSKT